MSGGHVKDEISLLTYVVLPVGILAPVLVGGMIVAMIYSRRRPKIYVPPIFRPIVYVLLGAFYLYFLTENCQIYNFIET